MKLTHTLLALALFLTCGRAAIASDQGSGVSGVANVAAVAGGRGFSAGGVSSPGPSYSTAGGLGVTSSINAGGLHSGTSEETHSTGTASITISGKGRSTMETVLGRAPTYVPMVAGKGSSSTTSSVAP